MKRHRPNLCAACQRWKQAVRANEATCIHAWLPNGQCELCLNHRAEVAPRG